MYSQSAWHYRARTVCYLPTRAPWACHRSHCPVVHQCHCPISASRVLLCLSMAGLDSQTHAEYWHAHSHTIDLTPNTTVCFGPSSTTHYLLPQPKPGHPKPDCKNVLLKLIGAEYDPALCAGTCCHSKPLISTWHMPSRALKQQFTLTSGAQETPPSRE